MDKKRKTVFILGLALLLCSGGILLNGYLKQRGSENVYRELAQEMETSPEEETQQESLREEPAYAAPVDFEHLRQLNPEVVGWLTIPGTAIDYPILHDPESNDTYLTRDIEGNESAAGSIYLDCDNAADFSAYHNVIYGHHMRNGTMFADIMKFRDQEFLENHQTITIYLPDRELHLCPYACLYTTPDGFRRKTQFDSREQLQEYAEEMVKNATAFIKPEQEIERLYSLVTCSYEFEDARTILYCYEID